MWHCGSEQKRMVVEECIVLHTLECTRDPDNLICCDPLGSEPGIGWGCHQLPDKTNTMRSLSTATVILFLRIPQPRAMFQPPEVRLRNSDPLQQRPANHVEAWHVQVNLFAADAHRAPSSHLPAGVRHDAEQLARNAPSEGRLSGFDATQSRPEILQVVFSSLSPCTASLSLTLRPRCTLPLLHSHGFSSHCCARLPAIHPLVIQGLELTVLPPPPGGGWCNPLSRRKNWGSSPPAPVVVVLSVPLLVIQGP